MSKQINDVGAAARAFEKFADTLEPTNLQTEGGESRESSLKKFSEDPRNQSFFKGGAVKEQHVITADTKSTPLNESKLRRQLEDLTRTELESMIVEMYKNERKYKSILKVING